MENGFHSLAETIAINISASETKGNLPLGKMILLGLLAGAFIAFGAVSSSTAVFGIENTGLLRLVSGTVFPVGLMLIVICGGELFTGNCLMGMAALHKQMSWLKVFKNLVVVWISNFAGTVAIAALASLSGNFDLGNGQLGAYTIKIAAGKAGMGFVSCLTSGILCNMLVCLAVLSATAARDIAGKVMSIFFPICAFVTAGFEHSVANMYYIPAGMLANLNPAYAKKAQELYRVTAEQLDHLNIASLFGNLLPVTLGNIIGGGTFIGAAYFLIYGKNIRTALQNRR